MQLEDYDLAICCLVDTRYKRHHDRISRLFSGRLKDLRFVVNGKGNLLPPEAYSFTTQDPPKGWVYTLGAYQQFVAFKSAVGMAKDLGARSFLWIEDDCTLADDFGPVLYEASLTPAPRWDLFYYGANHTDATCRVYSDHLMKVEHSLMAHMVGIRSTVYRSLLRMKPVQIIDQYLAHHVQTKFEAQALWPSVAGQVPDVSTLWNSYTDYADSMRARGRVLPFD